MALDLGKPTLPWYLLQGTSSGFHGADERAELDCICVGQCRERVTVTRTERSPEQRPALQDNILPELYTFRDKGFFLNPAPFHLSVSHKGEK